MHVEQTIGEIESLSFVTAAQSSRQSFCMQFWSTGFNVLSEVIGIETNNEGEE